MQEDDFDSAAAHLERVFFDAVSREQDRCPLERGFAMSQIAQSIRSRTILDDDIAGCRIGGVPSALLTYIGPYGIIDPATVKLAVLPGVIGGISVSVFDMDVDKVADALQNHAVVTNMFRQLDRLGMDTCNKLRVPHYAVAVELCSRTFKDEKLLRVHGHLWLALKGHTLHLHEMALAADALPYVNHKALTYMGAGTQRSNASHLAGNF